MRYYFFHIPKTAGQSLNNIIESIFLAKDICPARLWHQLFSFTDDELRSFKIFSGHFYSYLNLLVNSPMRRFVFLRDPIERALSHYGHIVRDTEHYLHKKAMALGSLEAFLCDPVTREVVHNFQARSLVQKFNPIEIARNLSDNDLNKFKLEEIIETTPTGLDERKLLNNSKCELEKFDFVGLTEKFDESMAMLARKFNWNVEDVFKSHNVNMARPTLLDITDNEIHLLKKLNAVDAELYHYACVLFDKQKTSSVISKPVKDFPFVSYAQNLEDVMLWRALKHVKSGFYIDVGASHPTFDSVTKAFYEHGWRGINIEPLVSHYNNLKIERPRDINLCCAAGETSGDIAIFECDMPGWATAEKLVVEKIVREGHEGVYHSAPLRTLSEICQKYISGEIHFLKIDVEGMEERVIRGANFQKFRPWIVVVESMEPNSTIEAHKRFEDLLFAARYQFAYADGLNRFYVANERAELLPAFKYPPNVFDDYILRSIHENTERAARAEDKAFEAQSKSQQAEERARQATERAVQAETTSQHAIETLNAIYNSRSWRITAPFRLIGTFVRWVTRGSIAWLTFATTSRPRRIVRQLVIHLKLYVSVRPRFKAVALRLLAHCPDLMERLKRVGRQLEFQIQSKQENSTIEMTEHLSPRARRIYNDLKAAIERRQKEQG